MSVNVKLLKKVRKLIADNPQRLDMAEWGKRTPCETVACLGGWTILASKPKREWPTLFDSYGSIKRPSPLRGDIAGKAAKLLGLPRAMCPFFRVSWGVADVLDWIDEQLANAKAARV